MFVFRACNLGRGEGEEMLLAECVCVCVCHVNNFTVMTSGNSYP